MLNKLIRFSLSQRGFILVAALVVLILGIKKSQELPIEVLPDLTKPTVTIMTEAKGFAPEEVETLITIPLENKLMFLNPSDIIYCKSDGNYCKIFTKDDTFLISKTLKFVEDLLPESQFYRIHQSYIVNLETIDAFNRSTNYVKLNNQKELPVSRSKRSDFLHQL